MFHELGHAIHKTVSCTKYAIPPSRDFNETPSIMLENWIWIPEVLISLGKHYTCLNSDHTAKVTDENKEGMLPRSLAEDVARTKTLNLASDMLSQIQPALFDLAIYTPANHKAAIDMDTTVLWNTTRRDVLIQSYGDTSEDLGFGQAQFPHAFRKCDAGYFAYPL
jgi:metallopeptidase MepB